MATLFLPKHTKSHFMKQYTDEAEVPVLPESAIELQELTTQLWEQYHSPQVKKEQKRAIQKLYNEAALKLNVMQRFSAVRYIS